jgi:hypothetical protein
MTGVCALLRSGHTDGVPMDAGTAGDDGVVGLAGRVVADGCPVGRGIGPAVGRADTVCVGPASTECDDGAGGVPAGNRAVATVDVATGPAGTGATEGRERSGQPVAAGVDDAVIDGVS